MATKKTETKTVTSKDMYLPKSGWDNVESLEELNRIADYFGTEQCDSVGEQIAAFAEDGVTYAQYAKAFKIPLPDDYVEEKELEEVIDTVEVEETVEDDDPITQERVPQFTKQKDYLIKMTRGNPYFEVANLSDLRKVYRFTTDHPYAVMDANTAQYVLANETGFRQAFPDELAEFYSD